jgi:POT family proton-dependent oligopeptide transporter
MTSHAQSGVPETAGRARDLFGHPPGLTALFATELWERFSYYGNAALIVLYMVKYLLEPGRIDAVIGFAAVKEVLEFLFGRLETQPLASHIFGFYTGFAYLTPLLGGLLADRVLGQRLTVVIGGILMAIGHFLMAFEALFLIALLLLILGIGAFKPNISTQVGALYVPNDNRRDRAYSIFYVGINIGAFIAPLVCGAVAASLGWHYGFAAAGLGMLISLGIYACGWRALPADESPRATAVPVEKTPLTREERRVALALIGVCLLVTFFWAAYDQQGNTLVLWAEDFTDRSVDLYLWKGEIPAAWFLALNPLMIFLLTPLLVRMWAWQAARGTEPFTISKMAFACVCVAIAYLIMAAAASVADGGKASPLWLVGYFAVVTLGELYLSPIGLSLMSKSAPVRIRSMMMGLWFATTFPADILAGYLGGFWSSMAKTNFFLMIAAIAAFGGVLIGASGRALRSMLESQRP